MKEIKFTDKSKAKKIIDLFLVCAIFMLCLITVVATKNAGDTEPEAPAVMNSQTDEPDLDDTIEENLNISEKSENEIYELQNHDKALNEERKASEASEVSEVTEFDGIEFMLPLSGDIIREYSADKPLYNSTMDDWRIHRGVDVCSEKGTDVAAAENGVVEFSGFDAELGYTVIVVTDKYRCIYASLESNIPVSKGDEVSKGEIIGYIGNSMISEICDNPHLHFEMKENDEYVNPRDYITF